MGPRCQSLAGGGGGGGGGGEKGGGGGGGGGGGVGRGGLKKCGMVSNSLSRISSLIKYLL